MAVQGKTPPQLRIRRLQKESAPRLSRLIALSEALGFLSKK
jgi:hypothetical protein